MKIGELARRTGLTAHTIRYYERIGLMPYAPRGQDRQRDYDPSILAWIEFLGRMKTIGMPIRDMLRYAKLREQGSVTKPERRALLEEHRARVIAHISDLQACLAVLDTKITGYSGSHMVENTNDAHPSQHGKQVRARTARTL